MVRGIIFECPEFMEQIAYYHGRAESDDGRCQIPQSEIMDAYKKNHQIGSGREPSGKNVSDYLDVFGHAESTFFGFNFSLYNNINKKPLKGAFHLYLLKLRLWDDVGTYLMSLRAVDA
jgi:hypothetical protein